MDEGVRRLRGEQESYFLDRAQSGGAFGISKCVGAGIALSSARLLVDHILTGAVAHVDQTHTHISSSSRWMAIIAVKAATGTMMIEEGSGSPPVPPLYCGSPGVVREEACKWVVGGSVTSLSPLSPYAGMFSTACDIRRTGTDIEVGISAACAATPLLTNQAIAQAWVDFLAVYASNSN